MAWTFTTLKSSIQDYLETTESTFVSELPNIITRAEERILKSVQLPNFRKNVTGACVSGNPYLQTPSDFLALYSIISTSLYQSLSLRMGLAGLVITLKTPCFMAVLLRAIHS